MVAAASSSMERVVSFFSRVDDRSRGNSLSTRACFAAMSTPRYLFAAFAVPTISLGVNTRIGDLACVERLLILNLELQPLHELRHLVAQACYPLAAGHFGVDDCLDVVH